MWSPSHVLIVDIKDKRSQTQSLAPSKSPAPVSMFPPASVSVRVAEHSPEGILGVYIRPCQCSTIPTFKVICLFVCLFVCLFLRQSVSVALELVLELAL